MVCFVPAVGMGQFHTVTGGAEVRLDVTRRTRLVTFVVHNVRMGGEPGVFDSPAGMVACVAVAASFPDRDGPVTRCASVVPAFQGGAGVVVFGPSFGMRHLQTVAGIAELLLGVTRRTREL